VGNPDTIKKVIEIVKEDLNKNENIVVVFSAFQTITNLLISTGELASVGNEEYKLAFSQIKNIHLTAIEKLTDGDILRKTRTKVFKLLDDLEKLIYGISLIKELSPRSRDHLMSYGERLSCTIITGAFINCGIKAEFLDSRKVVKTDDNFGNARVNFQLSNQLIKEHFEGVNNLQVVCGFIGSTSENETTTLGRGGSDYTASIFGAALDVDEIQIWTDVDGVLTADPKKVKKALPIQKMSYEEALEMSHFGAKVIYPPTIRPALIKSIPIIIKNTFNPCFVGTEITTSAFSSDYAITGISTIENVALIKIQGTGLVDVANIAGRIFKIIAKESINVILISQASSGHSICFTVLETQSAKAVALIEEELKYELNEGFISSVEADKEVSIVAVVGENIRNMSGVSEKIFQALGRNGIEISAIAQGSSRLNISFVIKRKDESKALNAIHDNFFLSDYKAINVFMVGTGSLGRTFIQQLKNQSTYLYEELNLDIKIIGIANTRKMLFDNNGINIESWEKDLNIRGRESNIENFFELLKQSNLPNSVFVDCTSSEIIIDKYLDLLSSAVSIVTPNKKANTSRYDYYLQLKKAVKKYNVSFFYESNVGAGLPIISTIQDFVYSGDKILQIEGVLSGTLSYLFNNLSKECTFSQIIKDAHEKGFTEVDPREDLSGIDIARKLLILVREAGYKLELEEIKIENLVPSTLIDGISKEEFFNRLNELDDLYEKKRINAEEENKVLRYIAKYEDGKASVVLEAVDLNHPLYSLSSNDNKISFKTVYYNERPVIMRGPGAGVKVTSGGILADIVRIANNFY